MIIKLKLMKVEVTFGACHITFLQDGPHLPSVTNPMVIQVPKSQMPVWMGRINGGQFTMTLKAEDKMVLEGEQP